MLFKFQENILAVVLWHFHFNKAFPFKRLLSLRLIWQGLEVIESTNLKYFTKEMTAEFYALKGMFLAQINKWVCWLQEALAHIWKKCSQSQHSFWAEKLFHIFIPG